MDMMKFQIIQSSPQLILSVKACAMQSSGTETLKGSKGILHGLEKFHHFCFAKEVYVIIDHKPLVAMVSKDVATLSWQLQYIILCIHQYSMHIMYKPGAELCIVD